jgi:Exostosin family
VEKSISNKYHLLLKDQELVELDIYDSDNLSSELMWIAYPREVLKMVEQSLTGRGLIFYITRDELDKLPSYGKNIVVIIAADEWYRIPKYAHQVLAIFKSYGVKPFLGCNPLLEPSYCNLISLIQFLRIWLYYLPGLFNYCLIVFKIIFLRKSNSPKIYTIPLGYYNQLNTKPQNISERTYDVFFAGSVDNDSYDPGSLKSFIGKLLKPPKTQSRQKMISNLYKFQSKCLNSKVKLSLTSGFYSMTEEDIQTYATQLMNSKICLIPRGTSYETYRFYEAIRFGCIPIIEPLPSRWFYDDSPAIKVKNWNGLTEILEKLLTNQDLMQAKHKEAIWWWENKCSEIVVGDFIVDKINEAMKK